MNHSVLTRFLKAMIIAVTATAFFVTLLSSPYSTSASATSNLSVNSPYGSTFGSGIYQNDTRASFGVFPTIVYDATRTVRHVFLGWSCSGYGCYSGSNATASVTLNNNITENANWDVQYLLSTSVTGNGSVDPSGYGWYSPNTVIVVTEYPQDGWFFGYWSLDGQNVGSSQTYAIRINSPHRLVANFIKPEIESKLSNVSDAFGNNLRNPDGTFYRLDQFSIQYGVLIVGGNSLPPGISFKFEIGYPHNVLSEIANGRGHAIFIILPDALYGPNNISLSVSVLNFADSSNRTIPIQSYVPFAIVSYSPHFTYFSCMDYNVLASNSYERPFITLVRYDGNSPGYSYSGDNNTDPFNALNSTGERAIVNNFAFLTNGWSILPNVSVVNDSMGVINFSSHPGLELKVSNLNQTEGPDVITWVNRVQKFFFLSDTQQIKTYVNSNSIIYFNVTVDASYTNRYNSLNFSSSDFSTHYLYEPIFYNGYLVFKAYGNESSSFTVAITSKNPSPLDNRLILEASSIFGNDSNVINSLKQDLYPAFSTTALKPIFSNSTDYMYLINQTNLALPSDGEIPNFTITVNANTGYTEYNYQPNNPPYFLSSPTTHCNQLSKNVTYDVYDYYTLFELGDFPPSFPFANLTGYNLMQPDNNTNLILQPLNFSFTSSFAYLLRTYGNPSAPFFVTIEPGNLTNSFPMIFGENQTTWIYPDFAGGGVIGLDGNPVALDGGASYQVSLLMGNESGGASYIWVVNDRGQVLLNESLPTSSLSNSYLGPAANASEITFQFPVADTNHSVTIYVENPWGGVSIIDGVDITSIPPQVPLYSPMFLATLLVLTFMISSGYMFFIRRES